MAQRDQGTAKERDEADARHPTHPALVALARLLARQAAREAFTASRIEQEIQNDAEEA